MVVAVVLALVACGGPTSVQGPTRHHRAVTPAAYSHYIRGRLATLEHDYATAVREFELARQAAPEEPELTVALFGAILLHLSTR